MSAIIDFIKGIGNAINGLVSFIVGLFDDLIYVIGLTGKFLASIPSYFAFLPAHLLSVLVIIFGIVVVYKILGREG